MKKILKKSLACMLAAILCLTACVGAMASVSAEGAITYSISDANIEQGAEGQIDILVGGNFTAVAGLLAEFTVPDAVSSIKEVKLNNTVEPIENAHYVIDGLTVKFIGLFNHLSDPEFKDLDTTNGITINILVAVDQNAEGRPYDYNDVVFDVADYNENRLVVNKDIANTGKLTVTVPCQCTETRTEETVNVAATCTTDGSKTVVTKCVACDKVLSTEEVVINATGHTEETIPAVDATCTETGLTEGKHCSVCDEVLVAQEVVDALGHAWDEGVIDPDATCTEEGVITYTCTRCPETKTEVINVKDHTPAAETVKKDEVAATCTTAGSYRDVVVCEVCGAEISSETVEIKPTGEHEYVYSDTGDGQNHTISCKTCETVSVTEAHNYVDGTCDKCGAVEVTEMQPDETLKDRLQEHRILIDKAFGFYYNFYIPVNEYDYDSIEVHITKPEIDRDTFKYTGETDTVILTDADEANQNYAKLGMFRLNYANISLFEMNVEINTTLYLFKNGEVVAYYDYGVKTLTTLANEYYEKNKADDVKRQFAVSLLNLGTAAQQYFADIKPDGNVLEDLSLPNADIPDIADVPDYGTLGIVDGTRDPEFTKVQLEYEKAPSLYYTFYKASTDLTNCTFTVSYQSKNNLIGTNGLVTYTALGSELGGTNKDNYLRLGMAYISFGDATLYDTNKVVTTTVTDASGNVIATHQFSVLSRLSEVINEEGLIGELYRATATFSAAAVSFWPDFA